MLKPKFSLGKDRLFVSDKFVCNGHWLLAKDKLGLFTAPKPLKALRSCLNGTYYNGIGAGLGVPTTPDFDQVIPKRDNYKPLGSNPVGVEFAYSGVNIAAYVFQGEGFTIGVNPDYVLLLEMGKAYASDSKSPILLLNGDLDSELIGVLMPMRLKDQEVANG